MATRLVYTGHPLGLVLGSCCCVLERRVFSSRSISCMCSFEQFEIPRCGINHKNQPVALAAFIQSRPSNVAFSGYPADCLEVFVWPHCLAETHLMAPPRLHMARSS